jgi:hypothetical protein
MDGLLKLFLKSQAEDGSEICLVDGWLTQIVSKSQQGENNNGNFCNEKKEREKR